jgi:hypothetical protein
LCLGRRRGEINLPRLTQHILLNTWA